MGRSPRHPPATLVISTALATPLLAMTPAASAGGWLAAAPQAAALLLLGLALALAVLAGLHGVAATGGLAAGALGLALHLAWPAEPSAIGLAALRWALLVPALLALAALWRCLPTPGWRLALGAQGLSLLMAAAVEARWMPWLGLSFAALLAGAWRALHRAAEQAAAKQIAELVQGLQAQAAELADTQQQMRRATDAAEAAAQAKGSFLAAASHDLRQPAHALGLYTAALRAGPLAPEQAEIADRMQASLAALDSMFAALLDVSRVDAGAVAPRWDTVSLAPLLHRLALEWAPQAEARGLRLAVHVSDPLAVTVTDPLLLERVLRNLLANAVKYTRRGGVLLACRARTSADGTPGWRVEVWDTGLGIAPAEQERVFEEFYQVARPGAEQGQGLGLGLAIVQRLVRLLQLRLVLHSVPGRGTVFLLGGLASASPVTQRAAVARQAMRQLQGLCVAVLEDDAEVRDAMQRLLALWGCQVVAGASAQELMQRQAAAAPAPAPAPVQALVADVRLAGGRLGPDEARLLQAHWGLPVPVLLVTGETHPAALPGLQQAGYPVLAKPVSPARLRAWLETVALAEPAAPDPESP